MFACSTFIGYIKLDFLSLEHKAAPATIPPLSYGRDLVQAGERSY